MLIQIKLVRNQNVPGVGNGWYHSQQKFKKVLVTFNSFSKKPFKTFSRVHYESKKMFWINFSFSNTYNKYIGHTAIRKSPCKKWCTTRAIYYIKPNQKWENTWNGHLYHTLCILFFDLLQPMVDLFQSE